MKQSILNVKKQYAVLVYNFENIENIPDESIAFTINDQLFFEMILLEIRGKTIAYSTNKKKEDSKLEKDLLEEIKNLEQIVSEDHLDRLQGLKTQLQELRNKKMDGMWVRSRLQWIENGEKVSRYFCNLEKRNYVNKAMLSLENENGEMIYDNKEILQETKSFYEKLYSVKQVVDVDLEGIINEIPSLDQEESDELEGLITYEEIWRALKNMNNNKSPGSDGYTTEFYKFFFRDIGYFLVRSINYGFHIGEMSVTQKQGVITCIPKEDKPKQLLKNWRPISLLNTAYKIASACIATRLKKILPKIIHSDQKGFMKGRYIGENIRLIYDLLVHTEREHIPGLLLMVDFEKAFDSVSWTFLPKALKLFNFGPDIQRWISTFYENIRTCVSVNGHYTEWFRICRGVRQGDPLSPYLYLIGAEILSTLIRTNDKIKGIKVNNTDILLSQYADDTTLCLDGSEESLKEAIQVLNFFAHMSGLKMNNEKTQMVWIGSMKNSHVRFLRDQNFCWNPGIFKILGVKFSVDVDSIVGHNFEGKLEEVRQLLKKWSKRQLTPFGKITVIKCLAVSKLTHLFINLPDPGENFLQELDCLFLNFLWDGKRNKIAKKVVCDDYENGGLKMINVFSFISTMKLSWLRRIYLDSGETTLKKLVFNFYPELWKLDKVGTRFAKMLQQRLHNSFWNDILKHYIKLNAKSVPQDIHTFNAEFIFYNEHIIRGGNTIFINTWFEEKIYIISQLLNEEGNFFTYQQFMNRYPGVNTDFLTFNGVIKSIKKYQTRKGVQSTAGYKQLSNLTWSLIYKGNKETTKIFNLNSSKKATGIEKWNTIYGEQNWKIILKKCMYTSSDVQLKWLQSRIIHRILPTNRYLHFRRAVNSPLCTFCENEEETICHLLWNCPTVKEFWQELQRTMTRECTNCENLKFAEKFVLFGVQQNFVSDRTIDCIILMAKMYIYKSKWKQTPPRMNVFKLLLKERYKLEKYMYAIRGCSEKFEKDWLPYQTFLS